MKVLIACKFSGSVRRAFVAAVERIGEAIQGLPPV